MKKLDINEIKQMELDILIAFDLYCRQKQICYSLGAGTMLGAVRHKGFIPWDDDMDICMPRDDYETFINLFVKEKRSDYWIQNIKIDKQYDLHFSKVRKKGTRFEEVYETEPEKAGIFVDIFPVDNTFDNCFIRALHQFCCDGLLFICSCVRIHSKLPRLLKYAGQDKQARRSLYIKNCIGVFLSFLSLRRWMLITESVISCCNRTDSQFVMIPSGIHHAAGETYRRKWFFPSRNIRFENTKFMTLHHPHPYLKKLYGDYMKIPDEKERLRHSVINYWNPGEGDFEKSK